ncbi:MAG TPA: right-handed parallel beta-helix repeat-containing protein, partial [Tepidisphaeraceae bacterium]|nr:right-handed parallel beta-helix repeat-containing protein [Tepidisphaeraceae bacterium]
MTNCDLHHSGRDVVKLVRGADNATLTDCEIHHSGIRDASNAEGIDNVAAHYFTLQDSVIHDTPTDGVYVKGGARWCVIRHNRVYDIGGAGISLGQTSGWDNFADVSQNPGWYENIDGVVRNNIVLSTGQSGIALIGALRPKVYNNTLIDVAQLGKAGIYIAETYQYPNDLGALVVLTREAEIKNNIVQVNSSQPVVWITQYNVNATLTFDYNCYYHPDGPAKFQDEGASFYDG